MLISLKLNCFRKHTDLTLNLGSGLNVLRGPNEHGKSTIIEAILYALYGTAGLRDSFSDTVTWSRPEKDLKVTLILRVDGALYEFARSKAGAECNYEGGKVTGQKEVSAFAAELLGADVKTSSVLMMASQNGLRGALDDGPAAVSGLMAKLADFDIIDRILEAANSKLLLGAEAPIQAKLTQALANMESARQSIPIGAEGELADLARETRMAADRVKELEGAESGTLHPAMLAAHTALETATAANEAIKRLQERSVQASTQHTAETMKLVAARKEAAQRPDEAEVEVLRTQVAVEQDHARRRAQFLKFKALPAFPEVFWEGNADGLQDEITGLTVKAGGVKSQVDQINAQVRTLQGQRITSGKCPTCGHAAQSDEHVAEHNRNLDASITTAKQPLAALEAQAKELQGDLATLNGIVKDSKARDTLCRDLGDLVAWDHGTVPPRVTWAGAEPGEAQSDVATKALKALQAQINAATQAEGRVSAHTARVAEIDAEVEKISKELANKVVVDLAPLQAAYDESYAAYASNAATLREKRAVLDGLRQRQVFLEKSLQDARTRVDAAQKRIAEIETDLKALAFNNTLVKKLKNLKPLITDHLWSTVLAAVGTFFSQMRGEQSVVTKDKDGFKVNGQKISSLSGSTLDVLALAIRVALTKTFIPHAPFLILDEPAHGCDQDRTGNVLGFLSGVGFEQVLLASHDDLSEAVADHVIALGA